MLLVRTPVKYTYEQVYLTRMCKIGLHAQSNDFFVALKSKRCLKDFCVRELGSSEQTALFTVAG